MVILTLIENETVQVFFKKLAYIVAVILPLEGSSSKHGGQYTWAVILCYGIRKELVRCDCAATNPSRISEGISICRISVKDNAILFTAKSLGRPGKMAVGSYVLYSVAKKTGTVSIVWRRNHRTAFKLILNITVQICKYFDVIIMYISFTETK
jgi:hypothetical protein